MLDTALMDALARRPPIWGAGAQDWWDFTRSGRAKRGVGAMPAETRAADAYVENEAGVWVKRSPNTRLMAGKGMLTFPSRVNLVATNTTISSSFSISTNCSATEDQPDPAGVGNGATTLTDTGNGDDRRQKNFTVAADTTTYTASVYIRKTSGTPASFPCLRVTFGAYNIILNLVLNTTTGAYVDNGVATRVEVRDEGHFWRVCLTKANASYTSIAMMLYPAFNATGTISQQSPVTGSAVFAWPQLEAAPFAGPPIPNSTGSSLSVAGPLQAIDLAGKLGLGVGGILQTYLYDVTTTYRSIFMYSPGSTASDYVTLYGNEGGSRCVLYSVAGGVVQAGIVLPSALSVGLNTFAYAVGPNYVMARRVGDTAPGADTSGTLPTLSRFGLGGSAVDTSGNNYQRTLRAANWYGPMSAHFFDNVLWPKAQLLAQVA